MGVHEQVVADLAAETAELPAMLDPLTPADWARPTPAAGWSVQDQVNHLAYFDDAACWSVTDPDRFRAVAEGMTGDFPDQLVAAQRGLPVAATAAWFRTARGRFLELAGAGDGTARLPWFGVTMSMTSQVTARLMETWAHGQDVADALGVRRVPTARLRHICHLGVATRAHSFRVHGLPVPAGEVAVELVAPDGTDWRWGPADAEQRVSGPALDFCLVVTQRRHLADTALTAHGELARGWLSVAQAYAGVGGSGRAPSS